MAIYYSYKNQEICNSNVAYLFIAAIVILYKHSCSTLLILFLQLLATFV
jgi:hypothetical protein